ncbi:succinyl-diaminopimelate desuccinylase [Thalassotalea euphylliae]|uniref:Succinyl-diaminopimelate desuccinylase n=1 Tax=Thalassotalea euphylliae TaxID=1655234 RepID=A0A3E0UKI3_9GAMM|nr:succinyl-diaminopimelate desuccinylase [Thalassotalea euphylliae]REL37074.1 succinyl-diaminopimelate desuccinylase [Thalassotalea euphylliae]
MSLSSLKFSLSEHYLLFEHIENLVNRPSITPMDAGCQDYIGEVLRRLGFKTHQFTDNGVANLVATLGEGDTKIAFSGHTDVVPAGDEDNWRTDPFIATLKGDEIIGRGIADMKGGIAAMLAAIEATINRINTQKNTFLVLITSDEEGEAEFGTKSIVEHLAAHDLLPDYCIVGEPTASHKTGDVIKVGRRGAISAELTISGRQGHAAYPQFADNAAHTAADIASWLNHLSWDEGSDDFPGTSLQITGIDTGRWTDNIIPGQSKLCFNIRYSHVYSEHSIVQRIEDGLRQIQKTIAIEWLRPCHPYLTEVVDDKQNLIGVVEQAIYQVTKRFPRLSTSGGTSDGRFIAQTGCQVVELGVPNCTIHQVNERVKISDLQQLQAIYQTLLVRLMGID